MLEIVRGLGLRVQEGNDLVNESPEPCGVGPEDQKHIGDAGRLELGKAFGDLGGRAVEGVRVGRSGILVGEHV